MIYLDNNATTKVPQEVVDAMMPYFGELYFNPSMAKMNRKIPGDLHVG